MRKKEILVSIITINYKKAMVTNEHIKSLKNFTWPHYEITIVDNNSGDDDILKLDCTGENTTLIKFDKNLGFAGGNNLGIKAARGNYVL